MAGVAAVLRNLRALRPRVPAPVSGPVWGSCPPARTLHMGGAVCAGHNKWSKVKNIKGPKDEARARVFMKYGMLIKVAVKEGGPNPDLNSNLAQILEQCRSKSMPKSSIETAIKNAEKSKAGTQQIYEARGPGGCMLLVEVLTDNTARTHHSVKQLLIKNGGALSDGARHRFDKKGVVMVEGRDIGTEKALELAIEVGAEDVQETEDEEEQRLLQFVCDMAELRRVRTSLEESGMKVTSAGLEYVTHTPTPLDQAQLEAASALIDALNDCPDVVRVWDNIRALD